MRMLKIGSIALAALLTAGCGLGTAETITQTMKPSGSGANFDAGQIKVRAANLVRHADGSVSLVANFANPTDQPVTVSSISAAGGGLALSPNQLVIPARGVLRVGFNSDSYAQAPANMINVTAGAMATIDLVVDGVQTEPHQLLVVNATGIYADVTAAPMPSPVAVQPGTPSASPSPTA